MALGISEAMPGMWVVDARKCSGRLEEVSRRIGGSVYAEQRKCACADGRGKTSCTRRLDGRSQTDTGVGGGWEIDKGR